MIGALLLLLLWFGASQEPSCPHLMATSTPVYVVDNYVKVNGVVAAQLEPDVEYHATSTSFRFEKVDLEKALGRKIQVGDKISASMGYKIGSWKPIPEAAEYNKRVEECRTNNGEF